jgi:uncharacterized repeat protein (TIGR04138 family)
MNMYPSRLATLLERDRRFPFEAYQFVRQALAFAQDELGMGEITEVAEYAEDDDYDGDLEELETHHERHLTGQQLCEAIRVFAIQQYGLMAKVVLNNWGIHCTGDFGEIVYNLISIEDMKKSPGDRREDFNDVFDFEAAFVKDFRFEVST